MLSCYASVAPPRLPADPSPPLIHRPPSTGDIVIFCPARGVGRDASWLDDNVFIKRIVAVAGGWRLGHLGCLTCLTLTAVMVVANLLRVCGSVPGLSKQTMVPDAISASSRPEATLPPALSRLAALSRPPHCFPQAMKWRCVVAS